MDQKTVETMPSQTALFTALRRTIAYKETPHRKFGPDSLAEIFLPGYYRFFLRSARIRENTRNKLAAVMPGMNEYVIARTIYFNELFTAALEQPIPQIVLLGAGYDSRAYRFAKQNRGTKIFELDARPTQERKNKCLRANHGRKCGRNLRGERVDAGYARTPCTRRAAILDRGWGNRGLPGRDEFTHD